MLVLYTTFVGISLMLWSGCLGHRSSAGAGASAPAPAVGTR
jgi:hypothetical protein